MRVCLRAHIDTRSANQSIRNTPHLGDRMKDTPRCRHTLSWIAQRGRPEVWRPPAHTPARLTPLPAHGVERLIAGRLARSQLGLACPRRPYSSPIGLEQGPINATAAVSRKRPSWAKGPPGFDDSGAWDRSGAVCTRAGSHPLGPRAARPHPNPPKRTRACAQNESPGYLAKSVKTRLGKSMASLWGCDNKGRRGRWR